MSKTMGSLRGVRAVAKSQGRTVRTVPKGSQAYAAGVRYTMNGSEYGTVRGMSAQLTYDAKREKLRVAARDKRISMDEFNSRSAALRRSFRPVY